MVGKVKHVVKRGSYYEILFENCVEARVSILNDHVFRYQVDPSGRFLEFPKPHDDSHVAKITAKTIEQYGREEFVKSEVTDKEDGITIVTKSISIRFKKSSGCLSVTNINLGKEVLKEVKPLSFTNGKATQTLRQDVDEHFFGGGTQNGRFCHKGETIQIVNTNQWDDGGVASPNPFYWSTNPYGVLRHTWHPGEYDFSSQRIESVQTTHDTEDFDAFYFISNDPVGILKDYYELTGMPVLIPEYAFYESHFNAYNRDYWVETPHEFNNGKFSIEFEDGKLYQEFKPNEIESKEGILESLNGENSNYQFSARAVVERYKLNDMPLGWFIPNDGYGAGYGQTETLDNDIANLKAFVDFCEENGVKVGLWTESNLHPEDPSNPKKGDRDISKEVEKAGIVALKTDVAWVGPGYSFGLNGIEDAANKFINRANGSVRPMIITVDGWAGTQRHSSVWTGDQTGGDWENVRFHIPTVIGTSLSGQPNVGADIDGIFGGRCKEVNIRDFQWKSFIPIQMNMDGWGLNPKTPFGFDKETTDINRAYLKLKSILMPYNYSIAFEALNGSPMIRSMFLEFPHENPSYTKDSQYQYMWGSSLLIAPVYNGETNKIGESIRNGVFLPDPHQIWIDLFTGVKYQGGHIVNNLKVPLWILPIFVKDGSIIPTTNPNNNPGEIERDQRIFNIYPNGESQFVLYEDDGLSTDYLQGKYALSTIKCSGPKSNTSGDLKITVIKTEGSYQGFIPNKYTIFNIMSSRAPDSISVVIGEQNITLRKVSDKNEYNNLKNVYLFDENFVINEYLSNASGTSLIQNFISIKLDKFDVSKNDIQVLIEGYENKSKIAFSKTDIDSTLQTPKELEVDESKKTAESLTLKWTKDKNAECYDVERDGVIFKNIEKESVTFDNFSYLTTHKFRVRSASEKGVSEWSSFITGTTKDNPFKNVIRDVIAYCNIPEQRNQELANLTINDNNVWHTHWDTGKANPKNNEFIHLKFDLGIIYRLDKMEYLPLSSAGNGTLLKVQYRTSGDDVNWTDYSEHFIWESDPTAKTIALNTEVRYVEIKVLSSRGNFGSGKKMLFYKNDQTK